MRSYFVLATAVLAACGGRWERVAPTDPRVHRVGASVQATVEGRLERLRVVDFSAHGILARRAEPCDSCELLLPTGPADSVDLRCGLRAGLLGMAAGATGVALVLIGVGTALEN